MYLESVPIGRWAIQYVTRNTAAVLAKCRVTGFCLIFFYSPYGPCGKSSSQNNKKKSSLTSPPPAQLLLHRQQSAIYLSKEKKNLAQKRVIMIKYPAIFQQSIVLLEWLHLSSIAANSFVSVVCTVEHHASVVARGRHTGHVRTRSPHPRSSQCPPPPRT